MPGTPHRRDLRLFLTSAPVLSLLLAAIVFGTIDACHQRLMSVGESLWPGYFQMRKDPQRPTCDPAQRATPATSAEAPEEDDPLDDLLGEETVDEEAAKASAEKAQQECEAAHQAYREATSKITGGVRAYRWVETGVESLKRLGSEHTRDMLVLLIVIAAIITTFRRGHIALRPPRSLLDHRVAAVGQLAAHLLLLISVWAHYGTDRASVGVEHLELHLFWLAAFSVMAVQNAVHLLRPPPEAEPTGRIGRALMSVPLFAVMALISGIYFLAVEGHTSGLSIYLGRLTEHKTLYMAVGLYVWVGMLLKQTRVAGLGFDVIRPWKLPPELLAFVVITLAAIPTAYSGASGIFVIAAGAVIYEELRRAGARRQLALAATAMSGSLGVVLRPCLLVVIVASLNKQVTTDQLFSWGWKIYGFTVVLFLIGYVLNRQGPLRTAPAAEALPESLRRLRPLVPYVLIAGAVWALYNYGLATPVNEFTAPSILPVILLVMLAFDRRGAKREAREAGTDPPPGYRHTTLLACSETSTHIGALLMLMALSVCLGGIVERSDLMSLVPVTFSSPVTAMLFLVVLLVLIGMTMDPYGAVILVSASIANLAYNNGIDPVHFWMTVLVAFELGYLTPPVALNHLLARQVVGDDEAEVAEAEGLSFWWRHERVLFPLSVMGLRFLVVAFLPLFW